MECTSAAGLRHAEETSGDNAHALSPVRARRMFQEEKDSGSSGNHGDDEEYGEDESEEPVAKKAKNYQGVYVGDEDDERDEDVALFAGVDVQDEKEPDSAEASAFVHARVVQLRGDEDQIIKRVVAAVDTHLQKNYYFLVSIWDAVKTLQPTRTFIHDQWNALVDILIATSRGKRSTAEASNFTLARFSKWPEAMQKWLAAPGIERAARMMFPVEYARHYLAGIIGQVDEELYRMYVKSQMDNNVVNLVYPTEQYVPSVRRKRILYFVAGWLLSKVWTHVRRFNRKEVEWMWIVDRHKYWSSREAVEADGNLSDIVSEVHRRNNPTEGRGLLFATKVFFDFVLTLETGYYHVLSQPFFLGAYLGDLPEEILRVVRESSVVRSAWVDCCRPRAGDGEDSTSSALLRT